MRDICTVVVYFGFWRYTFAPGGIEGSCWYQNRFCWYKQAKMSSGEVVPTASSPHFNVNETVNNFNDIVK